MYQFLKGKIVEKIAEPAGSEKIILEVNGIGYEIYTGLTSINLFGRTEDIVTVYTTLIHKEDAMTLYGFPTLLERELFNLLFSVSGIGPKTAMNILNTLTVSEISHAILTEDSSSLSKAHGIGERTASRVILELKQKIKNWQYLPIVHIEKKGSDLRAQSPGNAVIEARSVLQSLGYANSDISQAITRVKNNDLDSEAIVHNALKWLSSIKK